MAMPYVGTGPKQFTAKVGEFAADEFGVCVSTWNPGNIEILA